MVEEAVLPEHIAQVVSRWTGIPVDKMLEGEKVKLLRMEAELGKRVVGQSEAVSAVSKAVRRSRRRACRISIVRVGSFMFLGPTGCWQNRTDQRRWRISCLMTKMPSFALICQNIWRNIPSPD